MLPVALQRRPAVEPALAAELVVASLQPLKPTNRRIGSQNRPAFVLLNRKRGEGGLLDLDGFAARLLAHLEQDRTSSAMKLIQKPTVTIWLRVEPASRVEPWIDEVEQQHGGDHASAVATVRFDDIPSLLVRAEIRPGQSAPRVAVGQWAHIRRGRLRHALMRNTRKGTRSQRPARRRVA